MNHERAVISGSVKRAWGWSGWGVEGRSEYLGVLRRQCMPGLQVEHTRGLPFDGGSQEHRFVNGKRE